MERLGRKSCKHVEITSPAQKKQPAKKQREKKTKVTSKTIIALRLFDINKHYKSVHKVYIKTLGFFMYTFDINSFLLLIRRCWVKVMMTSLKSVCLITCKEA